jgi:hypothetical protein
MGCRLILRLFGTGGRHLIFPFNRVRLVVRSDKLEQIPLCPFSEMQADGPDQAGTNEATMEQLYRGCSLWRSGSRCVKGVKGPCGTLLTAWHHPELSGSRDRCRLLSRKHKTLQSGGPTYIPLGCSLLGNHIRFRVPPCPGRQVGMGVGPFLNASLRLAGL